MSHNYSSGVTSTFEYTLKVTAISPESGSILGGTHVIIQGDGFSTQTSDITVTVGDDGIICNVISSTANQIECIMGTLTKTYEVTNGGTNPGESYVYNALLCLLFNT
jgi:hypothetical protein